MTVFTTKDTLYGSTITVEPQELVWYDINSSASSQLVVELFDQDYKPLNQLDPQTTIQLLIRPKSDKAI
jgi:hypothetical protein